MSSRRGWGAWPTVDKLTENAKAHPRQLQILKMRSRTLDIAVVLVTVAGALTCCAALTLFFGALRNASGGLLLFALFGGALVFSVMALGAFAFETLLSGRSVREQAEGGSGENPSLPLGKGNR